jgi:hypothetical protein
MTSSRHLAALLGPVLVAVSVTEAMNMDIFVAQTAPVVYLNGTILFVAGIAIVRAHNRWSWTWPLLVTLTGWAVLLLGVARMTFPNADQAGDSLMTYIVLAIIFGIGGVLSYMGYGPHRSDDGIG